MHRASRTGASEASLAGEQSQSRKVALKHRAVNLAHRIAREDSELDNR